VARAVAPWRPCWWPQCRCRRSSTAGLRPLPRPRAPPAREGAGERVLVRGGAALSVDGRVVEGISTVNEAAITGEPFANEKSKGIAVFAGTMTGSGTLEIEASRSGTPPTPGSCGWCGRPGSGGERPSGWRTGSPKVSSTWCWSPRSAPGSVPTDRCHERDPGRLACGEAAGTPLATLATIAKTARRSVILNGGLAVEALASVDTVVFDNRDVHPRRTGPGTDRRGG
jgi:Cu+-exporting ATPase